MRGYAGCHPDQPVIESINFAVIANQRARWCGNLLLTGGFLPQFAEGFAMTVFFLGNVLFDISYEITAYGLTKGKCNDIMISIAEERKTSDDHEKGDNGL